MTTACCLIICLFAFIPSTLPAAEEYRFEEELTAVKADLDREYQELYQLKSELETHRQRVKTDKDLADYKKKLAVYDNRVAAYDEKRRSYDERVRAIMEAEAEKQAIIDGALSDHEGYPVGLGELQTTEEAPAEETTAETPPGEENPEAAEADRQAGDEETAAAATRPEEIQAVSAGGGTKITPAQSAKALQAEQKILEKRKAAIDEDFTKLSKEKEAVETRRKPRMTVREIEELNKEVAELNQKIQQFEEGRKQFDSEVADYNKRVTDAGLADNPPPEKK
ncbi:MAG: hypothetical protein ACOZF0_17965 [Thermodesulfobacteriota bacterium]